MYQVGDKVFHPIHGAGTIVEVRERRSLGNPHRYYSISLLSQPKTVLMVPVKAAQEIGLRPPLPQSDLGQIWDVLGEHPEPLPADHEQRYELLRDRLREGNTLHIAAALRDIAWREQTERRLTKQGKQIYEESLMLLAGEIALVQESELGAAEAQIVEALRKNVSKDATA